MAKFAVVVKDPKVCRMKEIERNFRYNLPQLGELAASEPHRRRLAITIADRTPEKLEGDLHTHIAEECPLGLPNCRNCGDPEFAETCAAAGHCPDCGTKHGIAPDAVVAANGFELVEVDDPKDGQAWDRKERRFV